MGFSETRIYERSMILSDFVKEALDAVHPKQSARSMPCQAQLHTLEISVW
jgi:hypothetical protein